MNAVAAVGVIVTMIFLSMLVKQNLNKIKID